MATMPAEIAGAHDTGHVLDANALDEMTTLIGERLPYFRGIALRRVNNVADAEDAVQNAFLAAWRHLDKFKGRARMSTWLTAIVINSARMVVRKRSRGGYFLLDGQDQGDDNLRILDIIPDAGPDSETQFAAASSSTDCSGSRFTSLPVCGRCFRCAGSRVSVFAKQRTLSD